MRSFTRLLGLLLGLAGESSGSLSSICRSPRGWRRIAFLARRSLKCRSAPKRNPGRIGLTRYDQVRIFHEPWSRAALIGTPGCGSASKAGPRPFRPQVIGTKQLSQIDWGFCSTPISTILAAFDTTFEYLSMTRRGPALDADPQSAVRGRLAVPRSDGWFICGYQCLCSVSVSLVSVALAAARAQGQPGSGRW